MPDRQHQARFVTPLQMFIAISIFHAFEGKNCYSLYYTILPLQIVMDFETLKFML